MIQVEVKKNSNETNASIIRRFTKRVQESTILSTARSHRYKERDPSSYTMKKKALKRINRHVEVTRLKKLGLMAERKPMQGHK
ncbi:MAG: hypothetical protein WC764_00895 [Candidatus Paceibacterota bacterium]|jgi:ribosomal protein S21